MNILTLFNRDVPVLTQSEIAKILGLNMTSTYRYINTLVELGYLEKNAKTKEIRPALLSLALCTNLMGATDHLKMIKEVVDRIHRENNISIDVAFVLDDALVRIYHREAEETLTYRLPDVSKNCLHNTALGKAYLSSLSDERLAEKITPMVLAERTEKTITDKDRLLTEIRATRARQYVDGGAAAISVLTEPSRFDGSLEHLEEVAAAVSGTPVMRKDFLVDPVQVLEARAAGASGVLLIAAMLDDSQLRSMLDCAAEHGLFVLLESFDDPDLARSSKLLDNPADRERAAAGQLLFGVNTRNLRTLHVDPQRLAKLAPALPAARCVAESGLHEAADAVTTH